MKNTSDHCGTRPRKTARRVLGFTMIEVIVAIVILGVLAGLVSVRFTNSPRRRFNLAVERVEGLLETLAHRQVLGQARMALDYAVDTRELSLLMLALDADGNSLEWRPDPLVETVIFDDEIWLEEVRVDGRSLGVPFLEEMPLEDVRPAIEVQIGFADNFEIIELLPHDLRPIRQIDTGSTQDARPYPVDLDESGLGDQPWEG